MNTVSKYELELDFNLQFIRREGINIVFYVFSLNNFQSYLRKLYINENFEMEDFYYLNKALADEDNHTVYICRENDDMCSIWLNLLHVKDYFLKEIDNEKRS